ncbi:heparan-alpha-glucosaminide N-acetyltransferase domain-containing protein [Ideonella azotifigens]|uniref:Heparan-alpha-glucosaminide N-acetyltransferase domain-containing protein n=1 Tax=Ideonella azotifigens TaxID=513160 RepID=A0ABN1K6Y5_9BURK|nr:heparan-alpha-glucosaminide N-acetyltransferase domain-containing protein [Ideonella azotifigens]MCD2342522.1 heparan-alpha-glucosaminide N-acetyltransferase domain-containing protein [Ideonella azotifigens]
MSTVAMNGVRAAVRSVGTMSSRLSSIDALRGLVMIFMLLDHIRETWFLYMPVTDPVNAATVAPTLFFTRITSTLCAPIFVALTGLGAYLFSQKHTKRETSEFLLKRGLFLVLLELTLVNFSWRAELPFTVVYLQVIWAIGLCMIALAALIHLPHRAILAIGLVIVCGHNLLDGVVVDKDSALYMPWGFLHHRVVMDVAGVPVKFNYPVLPWLGVISLGWAIGPWFSELAAELRQRRLIRLGLGMIIGFVVLRALNVYGDTPWFVVPGDELRTVMSFLAMTKYPPSLLFLLPTLGIGLVLLAYFERWQGGPVSERLAVFGGAPMFFYLLHLYTLRVLYLCARAIYGTNHGDVFGVSSIVYVWLWYIALIVAFYFPTAWFSGFKKRRKDIWWLKYL